MYETFEHTADLGLRAQAADLNTLFSEMAQALFAAIVEDPAQIQAQSEQELIIPGTDREFLLFDWLRELLYRFDAEHWLYACFTVRIDDTGLTATIAGEPLDRSRHELQHEVKAITYHGLRVEPTDVGWLAEVIVDI